MKRLLKDEEIQQANNFIGWMFWFPPILFSLGALLAAWLDLSLDPTAHMLLIILSAFALLLWLLRIRDYGRVKRDLKTQLVVDVEIALERVWAGKSLFQLGFYYMRVGGQNVRIPSARFKEVRDANLVRVAFLPRSRLAVALQVIDGLGL